MNSIHIKTENTKYPVQRKTDAYNGLFAKPHIQIRICSSQLKCPFDILQPAVMKS